MRLTKVAEGKRSSSWSRFMDGSTVVPVPKKLLQDPVTLVAGFWKAFQLFRRARLSPSIMCIATKVMYIVITKYWNSTVLIHEFHRSERFLMLVH